MPDSHTVISRRGLGSRLMESIKGVLLGLVLFVLAFPLLFWNEGRAVQRYRDLEQGARSVVRIDATRVDPAHEGKLVHLTGRAETAERLRDPAFGVEANALRLGRQAEMYQWVERKETRTEQQLGGGEETVTTYSYAREWAERLHDSSRFHEPAGHLNPASMPHSGRRWTAEQARLGARHLPPALVAQVGGDAPLAPPPPPAGAAWHVSGESLYIPADGHGGAEPQVGDQRIRFEAAGPAQVSVVARQQGESLAAWTGSGGSSVYHLAMGAQTPDQMFAALESQNRFLTWLLRLAGFALMAFGLALVFGPIGVVADTIPLLGDMLRLGTGIFAAVASVALSLVTIALGWIGYRPLLGIPLLLLAVAALVILLRAGRSRRADGVA